MSCLSRSSFILELFVQIIEVYFVEHFRLLFFLDSLHELFFVKFFLVYDFGVHIHYLLEIFFEARFGFLVFFDLELQALLEMQLHFGHLLSSFLVFAVFSFELSLQLSDLTLKLASLQFQSLLEKLFLLLQSLYLISLVFVMGYLKIVLNERLGLSVLLEMVCHFCRGCWEQLHIGLFSSFYVVVFVIALIRLTTEGWRSDCGSRVL